MANAMPFYSLPSALYLTLSPLLHLLSHVQSSLSLLAQSGYIMEMATPPLAETNHESQRPSSGILSLPVEIRELIYYEVLSQALAEASEPEKISMKMRLPEFSYTNRLSILTACRATHDEALDVLFTKFTFSFSQHSLLRAFHIYPIMRRIRHIHIEMGHFPFASLGSRQQTVDGAMFVNTHPNPAIGIDGNPGMTTSLTPPPTPSQLTTNMSLNPGIYCLPKPLIVDLPSLRQQLQHLRSISFEVAFIYHSLNAGTGPHGLEERGEAERERVVQHLLSILEPFKGVPIVELRLRSGKRGMVMPRSSPHSMPEQMRGVVLEARRRFDELNIVDTDATRSL